MSHRAKRLRQAECGMLIGFMLLVALATCVGQSTPTRDRPAAVDMAAEGVNIDPR